MRLLALLFCFSLCCCAPTTANRGHMVEDEDLKRVEVGVSTREDVASTLGSPSEIGTFDENAWYYIGQRTEQYSFFSPEVIAQKAVEVRFDDKGTVVALNVLNPEDCRPIAPSDRTTPTNGHEPTIVELFVGNLGRPTAPKTGH